MLLLAAGADVGARDVAGQTPLHWAVADAVAVAAALLDRGADLRAQAADGAQPVHTAALRNAPHGGRPHGAGACGQEG